MRHCPGLFPSSSSVLHKFHATNSIKIQHSPFSSETIFMLFLLLLSLCPGNENANSFHFIVHNILLLKLVGWFIGFSHLSPFVCRKFFFRYWVNFQRNKEKQLTAAWGTTQQHYQEKSTERKKNTERIDTKANGNADKRNLSIAERKKTATKTQAPNIRNSRVLLQWWGHFAGIMPGAVTTIQLPSLSSFFAPRSLLDCHLGDALLDDASFPLFVLYCIVLPFQQISFFFFLFFELDSHIRRSLAFYFCIR